MRMFKYTSILVLRFTLFVHLSIVSEASFLPSLQRKNLKAELRKACQEKDESRILEYVNKLQPFNPTTDIIKDFGKLSGEWKLDFTTAPEREVPKEVEVGEEDKNNENVPSSIVKTYQSIDIDINNSRKGVIYNIIDRGLPEKGLRIAVGAEPTRVDRVALDFRTIETYNDRFPKKVVLNFPPRNFFRTIFKVQKFFKGEQFNEIDFKEIGHFDVLFLDDDLRIQRNSEGNLFVNSRI